MAWRPLLGDPLAMAGGNSWQRWPRLQRNARYAPGSQGDSKAASSRRSSANSG